MSKRLRAKDKPNLIGAAACCLACGTSLKDVEPELVSGHSHASKTAMIGAVVFRRFVYVCPQCGLRNHRDKRVTWG